MESTLAAITLLYDLWSAAADRDGKFHRSGVDEASIAAKILWRAKVRLLNDLQDYLTRKEPYARPTSIVRYPQGVQHQAGPSDPPQERG